MDDLFFILLDLLGAPLAQASMQRAGRVLFQAWHLRRSSWELCRSIVQRETLLLDCHDALGARDANELRDVHALYALYLGMDS